MAADSRLTRTKKTKDPTEKIVYDSEGNEKGKETSFHETTYTLSDNAQKVLLIKKVGVGVSFCGNAIIEGATVADYIRRFEIEMVSESDTTEELSNKLATYSKDTGAHFFVTGYDSDVPFVFDVHDGTAKRENIIDGTEGTSPKVGYGALWAGQKTAITKVVNNPPILNADWKTMPLKDAIDFAEFLIDTTIKYERFCDSIQTCGGDIDILVVTKDEEFWKQHKIYNPVRKA